MTSANAIDSAFSRLKEQGKTAFIPFLTIGDPDVQTSVDIIAQLEAAGADMIELGVPYSDPLADGPVIQRASQRALRQRVTILDCMQAASRAREAGVRLPFILFSYYNPVLQLGLDRFFQLVEANGISGLIIPDLPIEEDDEVRSRAVRNGIHLIPLVAPTSQARIERIASKAAGFIYCVSSLGVTGVRSSFFSGVDEFIRAVKRSTEVPVAIGFGISNREQFRAFSASCDGVIVGSAIVRKIEEVQALLESPAKRGEGLAEIRRFAEELRS